MEILATNTHWVVFIFVTTIYVGITLLMLYFALGGVLLIVTGESRTVFDFVMMIVSIGITIVLSILLFLHFTEGPEVTYSAKITDFNEVYNEGYEIVDSNGNLYILRKVER